MLESDDPDEVARTDSSGKLHESNVRWVREGESAPGTKRKGAIEK